MVQVLKFLPYIWKTWFEFLAPGFSPVRIWGLNHNVSSLSLSQIHWGVGKEAFNFNQKCEVMERTPSGPSNLAGAHCGKLCKHKVRLLSTLKLHSKQTESPSAQESRVVPPAHLENGEHLKQHVRKQPEATVLACLAMAAVGVRAGEAGGRSQPSEPPPNAQGCPCTCSPIPQASDPGGS